MWQKFWENFTTFTVMYQCQIHSLGSDKPSFSVCLPGHNAVFPKDNRCTQADYYLSFKPALQLDPTDWTCGLRSVCYSNSYSTFIPDTEIGAIYIMRDIDFNSLPPNEVSSYVNKDGVRMRDIIHGYKLWTSPMFKTGNTSRLRLQKGLYYHLNDLIEDLNDIYIKILGFDVKFRQSDSDLILTLRRKTLHDPWIIPYVEGELADRIGLPQFGSSDMLEMLDLVNKFGLEASIKLRPNKFVRDKTRNIGLYIDFLGAKFPGLNDDELIRLPGRTSGSFSDTNIINLTHPVALPLKKGNISLARVQFKNQDGLPVSFPLGQNMVVLEFNKNKDNA